MSSPTAPTSPYCLGVLMTRFANSCPVLSIDSWKQVAHAGQACYTQKCMKCGESGHRAPNCTGIRYWAHTSKKIYSVKTSRKALLPHSEIFLPHLRVANSKKKVASESAGHSDIRQRFIKKLTVYKRLGPRLLLCLDIRYL